MSKEALELAKQIAHEVWAKYDDEFGYRTEKQARNAEVSTDIPDNIWFFWGQFDLNNKAEFATRVAADTSQSSHELGLWVQKALVEDQIAFAQVMGQLEANNA